MVSQSSDGATQEMASESELRNAADEARAAVAAAPRDEQAAACLDEVVRRYAKAFPPAESAKSPTAEAIAEARKLLAKRDLEAAEVILREHLEITPNDPPAMHMMAEIAAYCGLREDAERIVNHSARLHGDKPEALIDLASTLHRIGYAQDVPEMIFLAAQALDRALAIDPDNEAALSVKANMMTQTRGLDRARTAFEKLIRISPHTAKHWLSYGYLLKTLGQPGEAVAAYRTALALDPSNGSAWWALADLKNTTLFPSDVERMESALKREKLSDNARVPIHYALGKALDSAREYEAAISHIERGSTIRLAAQRELPRSINTDGATIRSTYTREFFAEREGWGDPSHRPIFIVGMHRAGSTLVEQILSSHSQIEGSEELFILTKFSTELANAHPAEDTAEIVRNIAQEEFGRFGERYLEISSRSRRTDRPHLTDKYPGNWKHIGLIHCMLPNAKIIDVRRNPMDCCFANYFQYYISAANHSFSQSGMAEYYRDYVETMRHFDQVLPGRIHRLIHDDLVDDLEGGVRRLLEHIGVPFEEQCLRFFETERPVHTPSSEQVRQPINRKGFGRWRNYEPWLGDLRDSLGETVENWRN